MFILFPYLVAALLSIFPPFYLAISGQRWTVLGLPAVVVYMVLVAVLVSVSVAIAYVIETVRGEIGD